MGAHHKNGIAERNIRTVIERARTALLSAHTKWSKRLNLDLWPFSVRYAVDTWNDTPREDLNWQTTNNAFAGVKSHTSPMTRWLKSYFPFGCPIYVLAQKLQDGKNTTNWDYHSRQCIYLGRSRYHDSSVGLVLNLAMERITPQYHFVADPGFTSVDNPKIMPEDWEKNLSENIWHSIFDTDNPPKEWDFTADPLFPGQPNNKPPHPTIPATHPLNSIDFNLIEDLQPSEGADHSVSSPQSSLQVTKTSEGAQRKRNRAYPSSVKKINGNLRKARSIRQTDGFDLKSIPTRNNIDVKIFSANKKKPKRDSCHQTKRSSKIKEKNVWSEIFTTKHQEIPCFVAHDSDGNAVPTHAAEYLRRQDLFNGILTELVPLAFIWRISQNR